MSQSPNPAKCDLVLKGFLSIKCNQGTFREKHQGTIMSVGENKTQYFRLLQYDSAISTLEPSKSPESDKQTDGEAEIGIL